MKKNIKFAFNLLLLFTAFMCISCAKNEVKEETGESLIGIPNPFVEYENKKDAENEVGFVFNTPTSIQGYDKPIYRVAKDIKLFEIIYRSSQNEIRYRKALGSDDISGDYNQYDVDFEKDINNIKVRYRGNEHEINLATWTYDKFTYSYSSEKGQGEENVDLAVETVIYAEN